MANLTLIQRLQAAAARSLSEGLRRDGTLEKLLGVDAETAEDQSPETNGSRDPGEGNSD